MKISEYPATASMLPDDVLIIDGTNGTKKIKASDFYFTTIDALGMVSMHRTVYRGKALGSTVTATQKASIADGSFKDLYVGDYWTINGVNWRIVDIDYWYGLGDNAFYTHHVVVMPDASLTTSYMMPDTNTVVANGYVGTDLYKYALPNVRTTVNNAFPGSLKVHREYLSNGSNNGIASGGAWYNSDVDVPSIVHMYGHRAHAPVSSGANPSMDDVVGARQMAAFVLNPSLIVDKSLEGVWLREVSATTSMMSIRSNGLVTGAWSIYPFGIRPVFAIA